MASIEEIKNVNCESNKKVNYSQRSPVAIKKAKNNGKLTFEGQSFSFDADEVLETALFEKTTRDCKGNILRKNPVRRFRKISFDEWFSIEASVGNDYLTENFIDSNEEESVIQMKKNQEINKTEKISSPNIATEKVTSLPTVNLSKEKSPQSNKNVIMSIIVLSLVGYVGYKYFFNSK